MKTLQVNYLPLPMSEEYRNALPKGTTIDTYRIESVLGEGGFGITYLVREMNLDKLFAMKELLPDGIAMRRTGDTSYVEAKSSSSEDDFAATRKYFISEARILAKMNHPAVVSVQRLMEANGTCYMVMDYVEGDTLGDHLKKRGGVLSGADEFKQIFYPLMSGLDVLHAQGIIHRDIKPGNIMVKPDGSPVLLDFGAATQTQSKTMTITQMLSAGYSPFEQYTSRAKQGPYTDIYALGATMLKCITGKKPDDASDRMHGDAYQHLVENETYASIYGTSLLSAVDEALQMDAKQRPQDIVAWRNMMERNGKKPTVAMGPEPQPRAVLESRPAPEPGQVKKKRGREKMWGGVAVGLVAMVALTVFLSGPSEYGNAEAQAKQKKQEELVAYEREAVEARRKKLEQEEQRRRELEKQRLAKMEKDAEGIERAVKSAISNQDVKRARAELAKLTNKYIETAVYRRRASIQSDIDALEKRLEAASVVEKKVGEPKEVTIAGTPVRFRWCPPTGERGFMMGSPATEDDRGTDEKRHKVVLTKGYWLMETEVTQGLWKAVMDGANPSYSKKGDNYPVESVSWDDCQKFINKLNVSGKLPKGVKAELPTEAQWEYACRAGTETAFHYGNSLSSRQADFNGDYPYGGAAKGVDKKSTVAVESYDPNAWGLYDMHGNVWEWCADGYDEKYYSSSAARQDPTGPKGGQNRVMRGGCWNDHAWGCRSANRFRNWLGNRRNFSGFRLSLQVEAR